LPSAIYDFKIPLFDKKPKTFTLFVTNVLTIAVVLIGVHSLGIFDVCENPLSSK